MDTIWSLKKCYSFLEIRKKLSKRYERITEMNQNSQAERQTTIHITLIYDENMLDKT